MNNKKIKTNRKAIIQKDVYRISVLTESLVRLEYSETGNFEDRATQAIVNRYFPVPEFHIKEKNGNLILTTKKLVLEYNQKMFSPNGLSIRVKGNYSNYRSTWYYGTTFRNLGGTARTLDKADGAVPLSPGLISRDGFSVYDDSHSLIQTADGWVVPRKNKTIDLYFFGYGHDYKQCLKDFYHLCGPMPLLPRYAFGNWWSRYYKYTETEYRNLIERFERENIPFSVAVMDMDWHLVDVEEKYGSGWTGYTWNRELFPEPKVFLSWLHKKNYHVTLNVHPAAGVRAYEEAYLPMAKELGIDWKSEETIEFDVTNRAFLKAYFNYLHHPLENEGVDFWWIDWQQQNHSKIEGLDPLWMLNHYHYEDSNREKRSLTFSRYAGIGSHRYPIGFSGDTYISWESLDFQPYFTATASNVGYGWWSHDIGGHMHGVKDDELATRWLQFGVFSPINRLHSSDNLFSGKEPWNFNPQAEAIMKRFLRIRHEFLPYLYTMNRIASEEGRPLILPLYYEHPEAPEAYEQKNEYYFGTELIAAPVTTPMEKNAMLAETSVWLPEGIWYDLFTGMRYEGGCRKKMYRSLETIPVLAKAGAILPMAETKDNSVKNPSALRVKVFAEESNTFTIWEDEGSEQRPSVANWCQTKLEVHSETTGLNFQIFPAKGNCSVIPKLRRWIVEVFGICSNQVSVEVNGKSCPDKLLSHTCFDNKNGKRTELVLAELPVTDHVRIYVKQEDSRKDEKFERIKDLLMKAQIEYDEKQKIWRELTSGRRNESMLAVLQGMVSNPTIFGALTEILGA